MTAQIHFNKWYAVQVWLIAVLVAPILIIIERTLRGSGGDTSALPIGYLIMVGYGALISLPVLLVYYLLVSLLGKTGMRANVIRLISVITVLIIVNTTLFLLGGAQMFRFEHPATGFIPLSYSVTIVLGAMIFKIRK